MSNVTYIGIPLTTSGQFVKKLDIFLQEAGWILEDSDYTLDSNNDPAVGWIVYSTQGENTQEPKNYFQVYFGGYNSSDSTKVYISAWYYWDTTSHTGIGKCRYDKSVGISSSIQFFGTFIGNKDVFYIQTNVNGIYTDLMFGLVNNKIYYPQTTTTADITSGTNIQIPVSDTSIFTLNEKYSIYGQNGEGRETFLCTAIDSSTNTITADSLSVSYLTNAIIGRNVYTGFVLNDPYLQFHTLEEYATGTNNMTSNGSTTYNILRGEEEDLFSLPIPGYILCNKSQYSAGFFGDEIRIAYAFANVSDYLYSNQLLKSQVSSATNNTLTDTSGQYSSIYNIVDTQNDFKNTLNTTTGFQYWHTDYGKSVSTSSDTYNSTGQSAYTNMIYQIIDLTQYKDKIDAGLSQLQTSFYCKNSADITYNVQFFIHMPPFIDEYNEIITSNSVWTSYTTNSIIIPEKTRYVIIKFSSTTNFYIDDVVLTYTDDVNTDTSLLNNGGFENNCINLNSEGYAYQSVFQGKYGSDYVLKSGSTKFQKEYDVSSYSSNIDSGTAKLNLKYHFTGDPNMYSSTGEYSMAYINFKDSTGNIISTYNFAYYSNRLHAHDYIDEEILDIPINTRNIEIVFSKYQYVNYLKMDLIEKTGTTTFAGKDYSNKYVLITFGAGTGQVRKIQSNTDDTLTLTKDWDVQPDNTSIYIITDSIFYTSDIYTYSTDYKIIIQCKW